MNQTTNTAQLIKRVNGDRIITLFITSGFGIATLVYAVRFVIAILSQNFIDGNIQRLAGRFTESALITVALLLLSFLLNDIHKNGKPFTSANVTRLRIMAVLLFASPLLPILAKVLAGFFDPTATSMQFTFGFEEILLFVCGVIVGIISEVFLYGTALEAEMDQIA